jgi:dTDP-glucose 4,6-dehydratase
MSTLLVTGGAGFIGSNFIRYWLKNHLEDNVINLDALTYAGNLVSVKDLEQSPKYEFVQGDILDADLVGQLVEKADRVVHFAAESHVDRSILGPEAFLETNIKGTFVLLEACRKNNTPFHHISTDEVFGSLELGSSEKFTEATPYSPNSPYSASKAGSDHFVRAYHETYGLPVTITNCSNNFGPYQHPEKFIPRMITDIMDGGTVKIYGDGLYVRDWLYVGDHVRAIESVLTNGNNGETYVVGGMTQDISNKEIAQKVLQIMGEAEDKIEYVKDRPGHDRRYAVDWTKIHNELGWQPEHSFEEWLKETVQWYKANESWWRPLKEKAESIYK